MANISSMITFVTGNSGKFTRFSQELARHGLSARQESLAITEPQEISIPEVAKYKAAEAYRQLQRPLVVEDSGLCIPALNNFPEALTKPVMERVGIEGLLQMVATLPSRDCFFISSLAYADANGVIDVIVSDHERGTLLTAPRGTLHAEAWSALSYLFQPTGFNTSMADMTREQLDALFDAWRPDNIFNKFATLASQQPARFGLVAAA